MFEKDAEEYRLNLVSELREKIQKGCNCKELIDIEMAFQKGAEFGYNKANEWNYVKDGNPDNENDILCQISKDEVEVGYYHTKQKRYYTIDGQPIDVIRWKEIVLPKESE